VYEDIADPVDRLAEEDADKTRLQLYRRGEDWYCTFNIEYDADTSGETPLGVDIGERHILAVTAHGEDESMLVSGGESKYVRRKYRSLRGPLSQAGALWARNRVGDKDTEETRGPNIHFVESSPLLRGGYQDDRRCAGCFYLLPR